MIIDLKRWCQHRHFMYGLFGLFVLSTTYIQLAEILTEGPIAIAGTRTQAKVVALTFDHSWGNKFTPSILETLKQHDMKVTFFIMGPWALKYQDVVKQMVADGHEIGSHGHKHENYGDRTQEWVKNDLLTAHEEIKTATGGVEANLLRPPNGSYSKASLQTVDDLHYKSIIWNIDSLDWKNPGQNVIIERVMKRLKPGAIILLHASDTPLKTAEALPVLLDKITAAGYKIVTVSELLNQYAEGGVARH